MSMNSLRKTHPMVLVAAVALTIFSLLGSAAISGLIPFAHSDSAEQALNENADQNMENTHDTRSSAAAPVAESQPAADVCPSCGTITAIRTVQQEGDGSGLGAIAGGVAGGVIGNQIGGGSGKKIMTVLGLGGGAYAGHTIEKKMNSTTVYQIDLRMQDGSQRTVTQYSAAGLSVGDAVKLQSGKITSA